MGKKPMFLELVDAAITTMQQNNTDAIDAVNTSLTNTTSSVNTSLTNTSNTLNGKMDSMAILLEDDLNYVTAVRDGNGNAQETHYKRADNTLFRKIVGSNPTVDGNYQTFTMTEYAANGTTVIVTKQRTVTYTAEGKMDTRSKWAVI